MSFSKLTTKMTLQITSTYESSNNNSTPAVSNELLDQLQIMVRKECIGEIDQACAELAISADPYNWSVVDVQKWLRWMRQQMPELYSFPIEQMQLNGMSLCLLNKNEFKLHFPDPIGEKLFAKIELWRMAMNFIRPDNVLDSLLQDNDSSAWSQTANYASSQPSYGMNYNYSQNYSSPPFSSSYHSTPYQTSDYGSEAFTSDDEMSDDGTNAMSYSRSNYHRAQSMLYPSNCSNTSSCNPTGLTGIVHPTVNAMYGYHQQQSSSPSSNHHSHFQYNNCQVSQQQYYCHTPRSSSVSSSPMHSPAASSSSRSYSPLLDSYSHFEKSNSVSNNQAQQIMNTPVRSSSQMKSHSNIFLPSSSTPSSTNVSSNIVTPTTPTSSSSHIHLWQFLKELLASPSQFGASIRWLDRSKGVFKIEDSVRVAKLWGARKNRPAMNYDKLSRSIRQYYKKGIMKKTERSQRLVYQFCSTYAS